jgi:hypothetical protein
MKNKITRTPTLRQVHHWVQIGKWSFEQFREWALLVEANARSDGYEKGHAVGVHDNR